MVRQKKPKLVIAFETTTAALAFENICKRGRLIPLPPEIKEGCGLAYCVDLEYENEVCELLQKQNCNCLKQIVEMY